MNRKNTTKGLRSAGLRALNYIRDNEGCSILAVDSGARTARNGHKWMYRTVHRLMERGLVIDMGGKRGAYALKAVA